MSSNITVKVKGSEKITKILKRIPEANYSAAKKAFSVATFGAHKEITANASGSKLQKRTGALTRSLQTRIEGTTVSTLKGVVFTDISYAPIHEYGGTIRAKKAYRNVPGGPYLNIPTSSNKTPAGVQRVPAKDVFERGGFVLKSKRGKYLVMLDGQVMFVLKKQVKIPASLGMRVAARNQMRQLLDTLQTVYESEIRK